MSSNEERYCGGCCFFCAEDIEGCGCCLQECNNGGEVEDFYNTHCSRPACKHFTSDKDKRHYQAVLIQANRYRRDQHVPSIYRMPNPTELGKAIDFACEYIRLFSKL